MSTPENTPRRATPSRAGFTLVEILCVVIILGIIAAVTIPAISSNDGLKVTAASRTVVADLIYAQNRAITRQATQYVIFDIDKKQYRVASALDPETLLTHPTSQMPYVVKFGGPSTWEMRDQTLVSANFDNQPVIAFDSLGTPYAVDHVGTKIPLISGKIVVGAGDERMSIRIEPYTGDISVVNGE
jgi:prepilin-type N-terminal cleavage/methylation domain-containing protein